jgi:protein-glutamine gamma-glutamyltransferase
MKLPRWFIGAALLFWGWQTGLFPWAVLMAAALEASHLTRARWEMADTDLNRICDLCLVLFLSAGMWLYSTEDRLVVIFKFAQWMPFCFFPIALAQSYGDRPSIPLSAASWLLRRIPQSPLSQSSFNISYGYFAICLLGASASTQPNDFFYVGVSVLILLALGSVRPNRVSWPAWIVLSALVLMCGKFSHQGLKQLQDRMERALGTLIADFFHSTSDPRERRTSIGKVGPIPLSDRIVLRVRVPAGDIPPALLREGAYDSYRMGTWTTGTNDFAQVGLNSSNGMARLLPPKKIFSKVEIAGYYPDGQGLLPIPHGTFEIQDFPGLLWTNRLGVAKVSDGPGLLDLRADYWMGPSMDGLPGPMDKAVPEDEQFALRKVAADLGLDKMSISEERQKIRKINRFFQEPTNHFRYSLILPGHPRRSDLKSPLGRFLMDTRAGHCEYFATATVLLLRQAGIYARYITGYAVPETARHGDTYLVRERHSHAWALVYHSDTKSWEQIDNTPSSWTEAVDASPPWWEPAKDFMSNLYYQFSKWRWGKSSFSRYSQWALVPLILYLVWRILSTRRRQQTGSGASNGPSEPAWPGMDSELFLIDRRLAEIQLARQPNESLSRWQQRLEEAFPASPALRDIFQMHRRLRFDPRGLAGHDRETLRRQAVEWLAEFPARLEQHKTATSE